MRGKLLDQHRVETEIGPLRVESDKGHTGPVVVGIRPEDIKLAASSTGGENRLEGKVLSSAFLGDQMIAEVKINETTLTESHARRCKEGGGHIRPFSQRTDRRLSCEYAGTGSSVTVKQRAKLKSIKRRVKPWALKVT